VTVPGAQRVLVTGGGTGIGRAVALSVVAGGGRVVAVGRRPEPLRQLAQLTGGRVLPMPADLRVPEQRDGLLAAAGQAMAGLDGLVHCAGVVRHEPPGAISEASLREQLEVNLVAPLRLGEQALAELEDGGAVVMITSSLGSRPVLTSAVYAAANAGLTQVVKVLALAGAARGIRVNSVSPGIVDTDMVRGRFPATDTEAVRSGLDALRALHPLGRLGQPDDVAAAVLHLLTAPWTTGTELLVDGGLLARE